MPDPTPASGKDGLWFERWLDEFVDSLTDHPPQDISHREAAKRLVKSQYVRANQQAYDLGRIDEAKTCEQAQRHDTKQAVQKALTDLNERLEIAGDLRTAKIIASDMLAALAPAGRRVKNV